MTVLVCDCCKEGNTPADTDCFFEPQRNILHVCKKCMQTHKAAVMALTTKYNEAVTLLDKQLQADIEELLRIKEPKE